MTLGRIYMTALLLVGLGSGALAAPALDACTRVTHVSHGGEDMHRDLGEGRVMWRNWWSQEGSAVDFMIVDCAPARALSFRTAEDNMNARLPFDRTEAALRVIASHESGARVFATLERIAADLGKTARDIEISALSAEPCACAALYGDLRGAVDKFVMGD